MTMTAIVRLLQAVSAACWAVPLLYRLPGTARLLAGRAHGTDPRWLPLWFTATCQIGFVGRWILFPNAIYSMRVDELIMWACMYVLSSMCAISATLVIRAYRSGV